MKPYWFARKKYGWGWTPANWKGWLVLGVYTGLVVSDFLRIDQHSHSVSDTLINFVPETLLLTLVLVVITYFKSEKLHR